MSLSPSFPIFRATAAVTAILCLPLHAATLVWDEEFDEDSAYPSTANWTYETGGDGWGNNELEYYTDRRDASANAKLVNGRLVIEARKETMGSCAYTSARIKSVASWKYGRVIVRAKLSGGNGTWPAFWMMPENSTYGTWPASGEIDIMEELGATPTVIHGTLHTTHTEADNRAPANAISATTTIATATSDFHDYRMDWTPNNIWMYVDDVPYVHYSNPAGFGGTNDPTVWPFDQPFYIILNVALGGWGGTVDDTALPADMEVEFVRVYALDEADGEPTRYDGSDSSGWSDNPLVGPLYVPFDPWVWSSDIGCWIYSDVPPASDGGWIYVPRSE